MFSIENICSKVSKIAQKELNLDNDKRDIMNYGLFAIVQISLSLLCTFIIGSVFGVAAEALIMSFTIGILRKSSGGAHSGSPGMCIVVGTAVTVIGGFLAKTIGTNLLANIALGSAVFIWSYITIYNLAPVDSPNKPIVKPEMKKRLKRSSIITLSVYLAISALFVFSFIVKENVNMLCYSESIYLGLIWQVFSLTPSGHFVLGKIDTLFK